jgi:hypothetical protein
MAFLQVNLVVTNLQTGVPLPGATVSVYLTGTSTFANVFNLSGSPISNPQTANSQALAQFQLTAGPIYDLVWSSGAYVSPRYAVGVEAASVQAILVGTLAGTSTSSNGIGTGTKVFAIPNLAYFAGQRLVMAADSGDYMEGVVQSYTGGTLTVLADVAVGSGTYTSWTIGVAGRVGPTGAAGPTGLTGAAPIILGVYANFAAIIAAITSPANGVAYLALDTGIAWQWAAGLASFTASIATTVLTVTGTPTGNIAVGQTLVGAGVTANTTISSLGTGTGGAGTYNLNNSQTVASEAMTTGLWVNLGQPVQANANAVDASLTVQKTTDSAGNFLVGRYVDGSEALSAYAPRAYYTSEWIGAQFVNGQRASGSRQIFVHDGFGSTQLTFLGNNWNPRRVAAGLIYFMSDRRGRPELWYMRENGMGGAGQAPVSSVLIGPGQIPALGSPGQGAQGPVVMRHVAMAGQSNGLGGGTHASVGTYQNGGGVSPVCPAVINSSTISNAWMFNSTALNNAGVPTVRTHYDTYQGGVNVDSPLYSIAVTGVGSPGFIPLKEVVNSGQGLGETPCAGFAAALLANADASQQLLMHADARSAAGYTTYGGDTSTISHIAPGYSHFANGQALRMLGRHYAEALGYTYFDDDCLFFHGETDGGTASTYSIYGSFLEDLVSSLNAMNRTRSRYHRQRRLWVRVSAGYEVYWWQLAQQVLTAAAADPRIIPFAANYAYDFDDYSLHNLPRGNCMMGELAGKWKARVDSYNYAPPFFAASRAQLISTSPYVVRVWFNEPSGTPLVLDTTNVVVVVKSAVNTYGANYYDSSASGIGITAVALSSGLPNAVDVTLSGNPLAQTAPYLTFGDASTATGTNSGPVAGPRTNIRNSDNFLGPRSGRPAWDWLLPCQISITG